MTTLCRECAYFSRIFRCLLESSIIFEILAVFVRLRNCRKPYTYETASLKIILRVNLQIQEPRNQRASLATNAYVRSSPCHLQRTRRREVPSGAHDNMRCLPFGKIAVKRNAPYRCFFLPFLKMRHYRKYQFSKIAAIGARARTVYPRVFERKLEVKRDTPFQHFVLPFSLTTLSSAHPFSLLYKNRHCCYNN